MIVAAERPNKMVVVLRETVPSFEGGFRDGRFQALLMMMSRARMTEKRVRSMVLPARSIRDSDFALSVASSISCEGVSGGSSKGPGLTTSRWLRGCDTPILLGGARFDGALFSNLKEADADTRAAVNLANSPAILKSIEFGAVRKIRSIPMIKALKGA